MHRHNERVCCLWRIFFACRIKILLDKHDAFQVEALDFTETSLRDVVSCTG